MAMPELHIRVKGTILAFQHSLRMLVDKSLRLICQCVVLRQKLRLAAIQSLQYKARPCEGKSCRQENKADLEMARRRLDQVLETYTDVTRFPM